MEEHMGLGQFFGTEVADKVKQKLSLISSDSTSSRNILMREESDNMEYEEQDIDGDHEGFDDIFPDTISSHYLVKAYKAKSSIVKHKVVSQDVVDKEEVQFMFTCIMDLAEDNSVHFFDKIAYIIALFDDIHFIVTEESYTASYISSSQIAFMDEMRSEINNVEVKEPLVWDDIVSEMNSEFSEIVGMCTALDKEDGVCVFKGKPRGDSDDKGDLAWAKKINRHINHKLSVLKLPGTFRDGLDDLDARYPHFKGITSEVRNQLAITELTDSHIKISNIIIDGAPGTGKTSYIKELAKALELPFFLFDMSTISSGFVLTGTNGSWKSAGPGKVSKLFLNKMAEVANPLIILDELDKCSKSREHMSVEEVLLGFLEEHTSSSIIDEFMDDVVCDFSHINFIGTSNNLAGVAEPLLSRMHVIKVDTIEKSDSMQVISNIYRNVISEKKLSGKFSEELNPAVIEFLYGSSNNRGIKLC
jgi:hypothetical protein